MKKITILLPVSAVFLVAVALVAYVLVFDANDVIGKSKKLKVDDTIIQAIDLLGNPDNICYKGGLSDLNDSATFGLQWGVDNDASMIPNNIMSADVTVWFNSRGLAVETLTAN